MSSLDDYDDDKTRLEDTADNGIEPEGMEVNHQDDDEGGEGFDGSKAEEKEEDDDETGAMDRSHVNANRDPSKGAEGVDRNDPDNAVVDEDGEVEDEEDDEDEDEDDEDDDEDEDEDEDEEEQQESRPRKKKRRMRANKYVDLEVEVDEDEEEEEDEGEAGFEAAEDYLERPGQRIVPIADRFEGDDEDLDEDDRDHRQYERRQRDREEAEALRIAEEYKQRHRQRRGGMGIQAMQDFAPRSVLMPGVNDPNIWCIKCKIGRERELVMSISRKAIAQNLQISSAFQRDSFHGHLYIEARSEAHVKAAVDGLIGVYVSNAPILVPIEEMPDLLKSRRKQTPLQVGGWVRIKKGVYKGDLARIDDVPESTDFVTLKVVPRIEMSPKEEQEQATSSLNGGPGKKRRRQESALFRPPPKLFNADEVRTAYAGRAKVIKDAEGIHFMNELYHEGYLIKDFKMHMIERENVNPSIDEIVRFTGDTNLAAAAGVDATGDTAVTSAANKVDLASIKDASKAQTILQPGDFVEIFEGSQKGISGTVDSISNNVLYLSPTDPEDLRGTTIEVLVDQVRKKFRNGDHIKVLRGKNVNESGLVLKVKDDLVTFLSDLSMEEITVFSKDIREAAEVGAAAAAYGQYELHDLIQLDNETVGVIFKIEPEAFRILDQSGAVRTLRPSQIGNKLDTRMSVATDKDSYELRAGDMVREVAATNREPRTGRVLHVWRSLFAFLHNRDILENGGVFVTYARSLGSVAPRTVSNKFSGDLTKMNPDMNVPPGGGLANATPMMTRGREVALGAAVVIIKGPNKGLKGIIKDINGPLARVELHTRMRTITIERNKLGVEDKNSNTIRTLEQWEIERTKNKRNDSMGHGNANLTPMSVRTPSGYTPAGPSGYSGYSTGKTPMVRSGGATPFGGGFGSATPFGGNFGGATPYNSGKTPAYGGSGDAFAASSRTPYAGSGGNSFSASSRTPYAGNAGGASSWGGATPYAGSNGTANGASAWGSKSPAYNPTANPSRVQQANDTWNSGGGSNAWGSTSPAYESSSSSAAKGGLSAPSPWPAEGAPLSAPTPYASAPTPAAQTPYASAPTPAAQDGAWESYDSAPTPAAAPTPYQSAATPAADGGGWS